MKLYKKTLILLACLILVVPTAQAARVAGVEIPDSLTAAGQTLVLNGAGIRKKFFLKLYVGSLYLKQKNSNAQQIIEADEPMAVRLDIISGMITPKRMEQGILEGFEASTNGRLGPLASRIDKFIDIFRAGIDKGDRFIMTYLPGKGTTVSQNGKITGQFEGLDFKQALFGIWLSRKPAQASLKQAMLGG